MKIDAYLTPFFPETESQFEGTIAVMIDVLRSGTSICAALKNGAKEIIPSDSLDKAVSIYNSLSKEVRFLGGERNGQKPSGFNAGNSPSEYQSDAVAGKTVIISTTNGTKIFLKAKQASLRVIGGFANIGAVIGYLEKNYFDTPEAVERAKVVFLCAGTNGRLSYEDTICAGAFINILKKKFKPISLTDAADAAKNLYNLHTLDLKDFIKQREHASYLESIGMSADVDICLEYDSYPVVPIISGSSIKKFEL